MQWPAPIVGDAAMCRYSSGQFTSYQYVGRMADWLSTHRRIAVVLAVLAAVVVGVVVWAYTVPSSSNGLAMRAYGPEKQSEWATRLVTGLNTHDVNQVPLLRTNGVLSVEQSHTIEAVLPAPGCGYRLVSVEDRGEQGRQQVPGLPTESSTYRFDMKVGETCSDQQPRNRMLGVVAIAEMSYWEPFYFVPSPLSPAADRTSRYVTQTPKHLVLGQFSSSCRIFRPDCELFCALAALVVCSTAACGSETTDQAPTSSGPATSSTTAKPTAPAAPPSPMPMRPCEGTICTNPNHGAGDDGNG